MTWMQTRDGHALDLLEPDLSKHSIDELAHALARTSRFCGHTQTMLGYSVAQHSVLVSQHVPAEDALWGLMHDGHEAYLGDWTSPMKEAIRELGGGEILRTLETRMVVAIRRRWQLFGAMPPSVKVADLEALATERRDLMGPRERRWGIDGDETDPGAWVPTPWVQEIKVWHPLFAKQRFLQRFEELTAGRSTPAIEAHP